MLLRVIPTSSKLLCIECLDKLSAEDAFAPREALFPYFKNLYDHCLERAKDIDTYRTTQAPYPKLFRQIRQMRGVLAEHDIGVKGVPSL